MPVTASELKKKFSTKVGAAGNANAGNAAGSLGKYISTTEIADNTLHNLFDVVTGDENAALESEYRCIFLHNSNGAAIAAQNVKAYLLSEDPAGANIAIGVDPTAASAIGSGAAQAVEVADENTAPVGVVFTSPTTVGAAIAIGDIPAGSCRAIWIRRTATNSAAAPDDDVTIRFTFETL